MCKFYLLYLLRYNSHYKKNCYDAPRYWNTIGPCVSITFPRRPFYIVSLIGANRQRAMCPHVACVKMVSFHAGLV